MTTLFAIWWFSLGFLPASTPDLRWLVGTWKMNTGKGEIIEVWTQVGDQFHGKSVMVKSGTDSTLLETLIISNTSGTWEYRSTVVGQNDGKAVAFAIAFIGRSEFVCTNPAHDYPQRIAYRRIDNNLFASIEGTLRGS